MVDARPDVSSSRKMAHRTVSPSVPEATLDEDVALRKIVEGVESETGEGFLRSLVRCVTEALGVAYAFVSELDADRGVFRTLAVWGHGQLLANFELPLAGTPCEGVLRGQMAHYADRVQERFPEDHGLATWDAESYCGVPLLDRHGVGRVLLEHLIEECERRGFRQMIAVIGDSAQIASIELHCALGFRMIGAVENVGYKFGRWLDSVMMQRALGAGATTKPD
jgi:GNAT superfamily N-acetyltransferase